MKIVVITGVSTGIGYSSAKILCGSGYRVFGSVRKQEDAEKVTSEFGANFTPLIFDVTDSKGIQENAEIVKSELLPGEALAGLVNNAGVNGSGTRVEDLDVDASRRVFEVNVLGTFLCAKYAVKRMAKRHGGSGGVIVNVSSAASKHGGPGTYTDYAASKGAIDTFTVGLAKEQAEEGIRVNCLRPGATMTELSVDWAQQNPQWLDWVIEQIPMRRPAQVEEIARAAIFLLSDDSSYVTGATLDVCGGWVSP
jgi:NAD(P)-dependent dehydrogenase (short-subunit alcohol dehydrogenase family)